MGSTIIPPILTESRLTRPFLGLAGVSSATLSGWLEKSRLYRGFMAMLDTATRPLRSATASWTWLHQGLKVLHWGLLAIALVLCTFASTDKIALSVILATLVLGLRVVLRPIPVRWTMIDLLVRMFFLTAVVATAFSSYTHTSLIGLAKFIVFLFAYLNFRVLVSEAPHRWRALLILLVVLGVGESAIGLYQYIHHVQPLATWQDTSVNPEDQLTRIFGTLQPANPNLLAGFLIPGLAVGIGYTLKHLVHRQWLRALLMAAGAMLMLLALILTGSRGGFLAILVMGTMFFFFVGHLLWHEPALVSKYRLKALWLLMLVGSVLGMVLAVGLISPIRTRFLSIFAMREDSSNSYRLNVWASTWRMIKDNWLVGIGPGNDTFKQVYGLYMTPGYNALSAYSIFLEMWAEQGIVGLLTFLLLLSATKMRAIIAIYSPISLSNKIMIGTLLTGIMGSVMYGLFDTIWYRPSVNLLFWLLLAGFSFYSEAALTPEVQTGERA